ncbi:conserved hypothetical protein [Thermosulfidibacter takaii ABI70S6]|uniref:DUF2520 domain-containing protein n=1 Tax=Thermosulfidibacter takaii (strain DSM 17441 / JCM 13301 / NBRC 103674 / ABI70S6) TaxID=1298851 RepID=A0A0S3QUC4_THET7|nr:Rossmann-like and DUF2520 domain-containing protein [Thermosulfidibacter takaii]BAT71900.1 conserved hypothetical protein [Thermosulfidibacter takaii ABI70S6]
MKVGFVGAGRVGLTLSAFFLDRGIEVRWIVAKSDPSFNRARAILRSEVSLLRDIGGGEPVDIIFLTVNDSAISEAANQVRAQFEESVLVHTSGAHSSEIIPGEGRASCHPLQSFADPASAVKLVPSTLFTVEGDELGLEKVKTLLSALGLEYVVIDSSSKPLYHAAAVIASNYLVTLMYHALETMKASGFPEDKGLRGLLALVKGTLQNIETLGVPDALTGPIARGDWETVKLHLRVLEDYPEPKNFYTCLTEFTAEMAGKQFPDLK